MKNYDYDIAVIMKKIIYGENLIKYVPEKVIEGYYDDESECFIDMQGTPYYHIIENVDTYGYCDRVSFSEVKKRYPLLTSSLIKKIILNSEKKYDYLYCDNFRAKEVPAITCIKKKANISEELLDGDIIKYYFNYYPEYFLELCKELGVDEVKIETDDLEKTIKLNETVLEEHKKEEVKNIDIKKLYTELTNRVIDQDEPIKKILTALWKQTEQFSKNKSRNILINGGTGVGKTEIFRILTELIDIPCIITSATQYSATGYKGSDVEDMLINLVKKSNGDIEKAQRGILIIDEVDKISESNKGHSQVNQKDVQDALLKILEDGILPITVGYQEYSFDTSKLMVIAMGSWSRVEIKPENTMGFGSKPIVKKTYKDITREEMIENGLSPDFIGRFNTIIQMNELTYDSFLKILKNRYNSLSVNREFLLKKGVDLIIKNEVYDAIAKKACKSKFGARDLDSIVETALSVASFEIASNPNKYSKLIIDENTINDNSKFILVEEEKKEKNIISDNSTGNNEQVIKKCLHK